MFTNDIRPTLESVEERMEILRMKAREFTDISDRARDIRDTAREFMDDECEDVEELCIMVEGLEKDAYDLEKRYEDIVEESRLKEAEINETDN